MKSKIDRLAELEKIAEKLGIGQNREVECVSCKSKIEFKDAIILTNKNDTKYLCEKCNEKLEKGELQLTKQDPSMEEFMKTLDKDSSINIEPTPSPIDWKPIIPDWEPKHIGIDDGIKTDIGVYKVSQSNINATYKLKPIYDKTNADANI